MTNMAENDTHRNKAVAEGAVSFHIDHYVSARVARWTYGAHTITPYRPYLHNHARRAHLVFADVTGAIMLDKSFMPVLDKVSVTTSLPRISE